jgi:ferrochelatase
MTVYLGAPDHVHGTLARVGVLLVNLGTPADPSPRAVRKYLAEFLSDPRVVEMPRALWWLALHGVILRFRPRLSAHAYAKVWTPEGSPLLVESRKLADGLAARLKARHGDRAAVELAMTYGEPSIPGALARLRERGVQRLLVLPLYPQYSSTTTAAVFERVTAELGRWRWLPELRFVNQYWSSEGYVAAIAESVAARWRALGRKHLVFSFHSIPKRYFVAGDPYHCYCQATARAVAARLGLSEGDWSVGFQSRFGREEWLKPYMDELLARYARSGPKAVTVVCPGFATDCLETLEEINLRYREAFLAAGGEAFDYVPCLNSSDAHAGVLEAIVHEHTRGWAELEPGTDDSARLAGSLARARALGAPR